MSKEEQKALLRGLVRRHGTTFPEDLGITLADRPQPLFQMLVFAIMASAPIRTTSAANGAPALFGNGWKSPDDLVHTTWKQKVRVLNKGGYARFDEKTSGILYDTATILLDRWHGDLRGLRKEAHRDPERERALLKSFKGVGDVAVDIFFREAQQVWKELYPFADRRAGRPPVSSAFPQTPTSSLPSRREGDSRVWSPPLFAPIWRTTTGRSAGPCALRDHPVAIPTRWEDR